MAFDKWIHAALCGLRHMLYPLRCVGCGTFHAALSDTSMLCPACAQIWETAKETVCPHCGLRGVRCRCLPRYTVLEEKEERPPISAYYHLVPYHTPMIQRMLFVIKDRRDADTVQFFGRELLDLCNSAMEDYPLTPKKDWRIAYVPRHPMRVRKSGTDQCRSLAREVSFYAGVPFVHALSHTGYHAEQKRSTHTDRASNAQKCYRMTKNARKQISGKYIILIDDILTSGATAATCAQLLKKAGAMAVVAITVAKTGKATNRK